MAQESAERLRQDREIQKQQEEEERQLRKKVGLYTHTYPHTLTPASGKIFDCCMLVVFNWQRLEEIMRRTRKGEADLKVL